MSRLPQLFRQCMLLWSLRLQNLFAAYLATVYLQLSETIGAHQGWFGIRAGTSRFFMSSKICSLSWLQHQLLGLEVIQIHSECTDHCQEDITRSLARS